MIDRSITSTGTAGQKPKQNKFRPLLPGRGTVLDGIVFKRSTAAVRAVKKPRASLPSSQNVHDRLKRSVTLMRQSVPRPPQMPAIKTDIRRRVASASLFNSPSKRLVAASNAGRVARSKQVIKHSKISRFGASVTPWPKSITAPVVPTVNKISSQVASAASATHTSSAALVNQYSAGSAVAVRPLPMRAASSHQRLEAMLDKALQQADAHKKIFENSSKRGFWRRLGRTRGLTLMLAVILLFSVALSFAYLKVPAFSARVASVRSGINAQAPAYVPPGFSLSSTSFKNGSVSMKFSGNSGSFTLTQQKSDLNSDSLKANVVVPASKLYQTAQYNGVTVYTYSQQPASLITQASQGNGNLSKLSDSGELTSPDATWVDHGVQAVLTNEASLSSDQLAQIIQGLIRQ